MLAAVVGLRQRGEHAAALALLDRSAQRFVGLGLRQLDALPYDGIRALLVVGGRLDVQRCFFLAELRRLEADVREDRGPAGAGYGAAMQALRLFMEVVAEQGLGAVQDRREEITALAEGLRGRALDRPSRRALWDWYLAIGRFARAEDQLFALLEEAPADRDLLAEGIAAYERMLTRTDDELRAGDLPRDEVCEGLTRLRGLQTGVSPGIPGPPDAR